MDIAKVLQRLDQVQIGFSLHPDGTDLTISVKDYDGNEFKPEEVDLITSMLHPYIIELMNEINEDITTTVGEVA